MVGSSVADPDPNPYPDPSDPYVFGPPGSGSTNQRYGSGSGFGAPDPDLLSLNFGALPGTLFIYFCNFLSTVLIQYSSLVTG